MYFSYNHDLWSSSTQEVHFLKMNKYVANFCFIFTKFIFPCQRTNHSWFRTSIKKTNKHAECYSSMQLQKNLIEGSSMIEIRQNCSKYVLTITTIIQFKRSEPPSTQSLTVTGEGEWNGKAGNVCFTLLLIYDG